MAERRIVIIGAGIGGSALGALLRQRGLAVTLLEKNNQPPRHSYGITLKRSTFAPLLTSLDVNEKSFLTQVLQPTLPNSDKQSPHAESSSVRVTRASLENFLRRGLDVQWSSVVTSITNSGPEISIGLKDGRHVPADILVAADGVHSAVCHAFLPDEPLHVLPFAVFNGRTSISIRQGQDLADISADKGDGRVVKSMVIGSTRLAYSVYKYGEDKATIDFTFSRPAVPNDRLHNPGRYISSAQEIPEELFIELDKLQPVSKSFARVFDASAVRDSRLLHWLMRYRLLQRSKLDQLADKSIIFMGDAAHASPILGGNGANEALLDAMRLAQLLDFSGSSIATFYDDRYSEWKMAVETSQQVLQEMHSPANSML